MITYSRQLGRLNEALKGIKTPENFLSGPLQRMDGHRFYFLIPLSVTFEVDPSEIYLNNESDLKRLLHARMVDATTNLQDLVQEALTILQKQEI
jgi:hypothetical protein